MNNVNRNTYQKPKGDELRNSSNNFPSNQYQFNREKLYKEYMRIIGLVLCVDFMGYPLNSFEEQWARTDFHHLRIPQRVAYKWPQIDKNSIWNGAILNRKSHDYYHFVESVDLDTALIIKAAMMKISDLFFDPSLIILTDDVKRSIAKVCFRLIDESLNSFEEKNKDNPKLKEYCTLQRRHFDCDDNMINNLKCYPRSINTNQPYTIESCSLFSKYHYVIGKHLETDFMGYSIHPLEKEENKLTYHHLRISPEIADRWLGKSNKDLIWNGALLKRRSRDYLHYIEQTDLRSYLLVEARMLGISDLFIDPSLIRLDNDKKRFIAKSHFRNIDGVLTDFEGKCAGKRRKGKRLIIDSYANGRVFRQ